MNGRLFVIEGVDGSGKATQTLRLYEHLQNQGKIATKLSFPDYNNPSSALVKMYLNGDFGTDPSDVSPYVASAFYAVDRFASFKTIWQQKYNDGEILIADRYTTSNMIHQGSKITDVVEKDKYLHWLADFEYNMFDLPEPTCTFFLDMPPEYSQSLRNIRGILATGLSQDIHEKDAEYLKVSYQKALYIAQKYKWHIISCVKDGQIRSIDDIHAEILAVVEDFL